MNRIDGLIPGVVREYLADSRECRVEIPGMTDGATEMLLAQIMQSIGDVSEKTEIEILPGDRVWIEFECGDQRFPIIVGYRAKNVGNRLQWRRWHHQNVEVLADDVLQLVTPKGKVRISGGGDDIEVAAASRIRASVGSSAVTVTGSSIKLEAGGSSISIDGSGVKINGATIRLN